MTAATVDAPRGPGLAEPVPSWRDRLRPLIGGGGWLATLAITLLAGLLRFLRLNIPSGKIFDEVYYACDARNLVRFGVEQASQAKSDCVPSGEPGFVVHPPLGKWLIGIGEKTFGFNEFGWRFSAAVAGTLSVLLLIRLARRMTGSTLLGCLAGLLLTLDGLHFVQSRVAMLDIFLMLFVLAAVACAVVDRDQVRSRLAAMDDDVLAGWGPTLGRRPWLIGAGASMGAALATKWSGLFYLALLVALIYVWEVGARRTAGIRAPWRATIRRSLLPLLGWLIVFPAALYVLSWFGWFNSSNGWSRHWATPQNATYGFLPDALRSWWHYHVEMYGFHSTLQKAHPYQSHPLGWLLLVRPVSYYYPAGLSAGTDGCTVQSCSREVLAIGTPAIWWGSILMLLGSMWLWISRRDWRAYTVVLLVAASIVPWIPSDLNQRTMFLFYALPAVPFMCLGLALMAGWALGPATASARRRGIAATAIGVYVSLVALNFVYLYPILAAQTLPYADWHKRMWFTSWI